MILFYTGATVLMLLGIVFSLWPWLVAYFSDKNPSSIKNDNAVDRQDVNAALYRDHLAELETTRIREKLDQQQFDTLKQELQQNFSADNAAPATVVREGRQLPMPMLVLWLLVPVAALWLYQVLGNAAGWQLKQQLQAQAALEQKLSRSLSHAATNTLIERQLDQLNRELVASLQDYVASQSESLGIWVLLARNAMGIGEYDTAIKAYQQILERQAESPQIMAELAQAIFIKANNRAVPVVEMLATRALELQPDNLMALGLLGISNFQNQQYADAITYWQQAIAIHPPDSADARALQNGIDQARQRLAIADNSTSANTASVEPARGAVTSVRVRVSLADGLEVHPDDTVFVYARVWQGPRMPLAITRARAAQLPLTVELTDAMAMAAGMGLSTAEEVELVARISASGNAIPQPGDLEVTLGPIKPDADPTMTYPLVIAAAGSQ